MVDQTLAEFGRAKLRELTVSPYRLGLTAAEASERGVCRICGEAARPPLVLNFGSEFAHADCWDAENVRQGRIGEMAQHMVFPGFEVSTPKCLP